MVVEFLTTRAAKGCGLRGGPSPAGSAFPIPCYKLFITHTF